MERVVPEYLEYRSIVLQLTKSLSKREGRELAYLYSVPEHLSSDILDIMTHLETRNVFSPSNPEGLLQLVTQLERGDLVKTLTRRLESLPKKQDRAGHQPLSTCYQNQQLRVNFEYTLSQAVALANQVHSLRSAFFNLSLADKHITETESKRVDQQLQSVEEKQREVTWELRKLCWSSGLIIEQPKQPVSETTEEDRPESTGGNNTIAVCMYTMHNIQYLHNTCMTTNPYITAHKI